MNDLINNIIKEENKNTSQPSVFIGERMVEIGLPGIPVDELTNEIMEIYDEKDADFNNIEIISDIGNFITENIDLLIRMSNPQSTYSPEWYTISDDETLLGAIINRDEVAIDYKGRLNENYEIPESLGEVITELIMEKISSYEDLIIKYYNKK